MKKRKTGEKGVITILVAFLLTGILSVGTLAIEAGRLQAAKAQLADATISAATSMVAAYDTQLYERYGLLAIDKELATDGKCEHYLEFNSDLAAGYEGNNLATLYTLYDVEMDSFYNLTYPAVLKRQILSRAKYNLVMQDFSLNYYNSDYFLSSIQSKAVYVADALTPVASGSAAAGNISDIPSDIQTALKSMYEMFSKIKKYDEGFNITVSSSEFSLLPSVTGTKLNNPPEEDVDLINSAISDAKSVLGSNGSLLASAGSETYSETDASVNISAVTNMLGRFSSMDKLKSNARTVAADSKALAQAVNAAINVLNTDRDGNLLLNSYIAAYFPNKNQIVENYNGPIKGSSGNYNNFAGACTEYIFSANSSEKANQQSAYDYVMALRFVSNLYSTIINSSSFNRNNSCSVAAHIAWAYYESFIDTELLFRYNATVPLEKYVQILPINDPGKVKNAFSAKNFASGMKSLGILKNDGKFVIDGIDKTTYRDALAQSLWLVPNSKKLLRVADLIQLEMRYYQRYVEKSSVDFLMREQDTFCRVKSVGNLNSVLPVISLSADQNINGTDFQSVKYVGY